MLGLIPVLWGHIENYSYLDKAPRQAFSFLEEQDLKLPLFLPSASMRRKIAYFTGYSTGKISERIRVLQPEDFRELDHGYILFPEEEFIDIPETWVHMGSFGPLGFPRLSIFRALDESIAQNELNKALTLLRTNGNGSAYTTAYQALINLGRECDAYSYWIQGQQLPESAHGFIAVNPESACFLTSEAFNLLEDQAVWQSLYNGYFYRESMDAANIQDPVLRVAHKYLYYSDPRIFDIELDLDPSTLYYYSVSIQSISPVWTLYYSLNSQEQYLQVRSFSNWSDVAILFSTPKSDGELIHANLSPVLFDHFENVFLRNPKLINISPDHE